MNRKLIKQNKMFLSNVIILLTIFGLVLYFGGNQIYGIDIRPDINTFPSPSEFFETGNFSFDRTLKACYKMQNLNVDQVIN